MLGDNLRDARKKAKMTQKDLAEKIGVQRSVISKYESGMIEPTLSQIQRIADALDVSISDLIWVDTFSYKEDLLSKINSLKYEIAQVSSDMEKEELEATLFILEESYEDICLANALLQTEKRNHEKDPRDKLLVAFDMLNNEGQQKAIERVEELTEVPKYQKEKAPSQLDKPMDE